MQIHIPNEHEEKLRKQVVDYVLANKDLGEKLTNNELMNEFGIGWAKSARLIDFLDSLGFIRHVGRDRTIAYTKYHEEIKE